MKPLMLQDGVISYESFRFELDRSREHEVDHVDDTQKATEVDHDAFDDATEAIELGFGDQAEFPLPGSGFAA